METRGTIKSISVTYPEHRALITVEALADPADVEQLVGKDLTIVLKPYKARRSLDANAYFHVLCSRLADALGLSMSRVKNELITSYGQPDEIDGEMVVIKTNLPVDVMMEQELLHCRACRTEIQNGREVVFYRVYRGSHTYNTAEMSKLIDGTILECKEQGIETIPPEELRRMMERWGKQAEKKGSAESASWPAS